MISDGPDKPPRRGASALPPGVRFLPGHLDAVVQAELIAAIREIVRQAPLFSPEMPRTGKPLSVRMTNCGPLGWVTDKVQGYRYQPQHPVTGKAWPPIPPPLLDLWRDLAPIAPPPEACLVNLYGPEAHMGLHQDKDESTFDAPVLSVSLGDEALFRVGGTMRGGPTTSFRLRSGDVLLLEAESRLAYHGVDRIYPGTSTLLRQPGRINLTLRRVTPS
ncbi:alkylated DNA repair dioxygenase [Xaviernesmea oryzae]|uniref:Alkylated DNA repair dioxygenase n=1 Tax=Xaviernesmea oryzae TaxID=464029 RepID=A0A1Q9AYB4_9HYPH|nr:alpha-ketoglutarate-dependent dioxygenase AlkB [Xaviernesmea oryzae]OLP60436.1 alkylated DNA repair dioxygenase [Xaviernesmea oryzae]SEK18841.1 alkylated DNA repair protein (DNA oxidative demethylase) [Xaviernesmea oryzae]